MISNNSYVKWFQYGQCSICRQLNLKMKPIKNIHWQGDNYQNFTIVIKSPKILYEVIECQENTAESEMSEVYLSQFWKSTTLHCKIYKGNNKSLNQNLWIFSRINSTIVEPQTHIRPQGELVHSIHCWGCRENSHLPVLIQEISDPSWYPLHLQEPDHDENGLVLTYSAGSLLDHALQPR